MPNAFIGLGSNLDDPAGQILRAFGELDGLPQTYLRRTSGLYANPPMGPTDQPDYVNAVAELDTGLTPEALLRALQRLEQAHGRVKRRHWGERTLDLDILSYGELSMATPELTVPHPGIAERAFVLVPWNEIAPETEIPTLGRVSDLVEAVANTQIVRLSAH